MITRLSHATVYVVDQDSAKAFYTEKLGFEVHEDVSLGSFRWLTVAPKAQLDTLIVLMPIASGPTFNEESAEALRRLVQGGALGGGVLATDDCERDYQELKQRGVEFLREPKQVPYGLEALFRDDSGNLFSLTQRNR
jgi:predicted enzyme related to lactoylglutathione lyase